MINYENKVTLLGTYGDDKRIALSAWQSVFSETGVELPEDYTKRVDALFKATQATKKKDYKDLLGFLAKHKHHCYDNKTEILTLEGWKLFDNLTEEDKVFAVDPQTHVGEFEKPERIYKGYYDEPMYYVKAQQLDLAVTKGHRMLVSQRKNSKGVGYGTVWQVETPEEISGKSRKYLKSAQILRPNKYTPEMAQLIGFFIGDGYSNSAKTHHHPVFGFKKQRKVNYLFSLGFPIRKRNSGSFVVEGFEKGFFDQFYTPDRGKCLVDIYQLSKQDVDNILIGLRNSDGVFEGSLKPKNKNKRPNSWRYSTSSSTLVEQLSILSSLHKFSFTFSKSESPVNLGNKNHFHCSLSSRIFPEVYKVGSRKHLNSPDNNQYWGHYTGTVHCVTVSTGFVMVRRNGKTVVSGNTPFEKSLVDFQVTGDIATNIQMLKHRVGTSCVTGDTEILQEYGTTIETLYLRQERVKAGIHKYNPNLFRAKCKALDSNLIEESLITEVFYNGIKPVYQFTTNTGRTLKSTLDHRYHTPTGFHKIGEYLGVTAFDQEMKSSERRVSVVQRVGVNVLASEEVVSVKFLGNEKVYDLEVNVNHNYVANGFLIHNCNSESARYKQLEDKFYIPDEWKDVVATDENLHGLQDTILELQIGNQTLTWAEVLERHTKNGNALYHAANKQLRGSLGTARAKETSRYFLGYNKQLNYDFTFNIRSLYHFCHLRAKPEAQKEIRDLAKMMIKLVKDTDKFNVSLEVLGLLDLLD